MTQISQLRPGQKVRFFRSHDKSTELTGTIVAVQTNGNMVRIKTDAVKGSVARLEEAHCDDVFFAGSAPAATGVAAKWDEGAKADEPNVVNATPSGAEPPKS